MSAIGAALLVSGFGLIFVIFVLLWLRGKVGEGIPAIETSGTTLTVTFSSAKPATKSLTDSETKAEKAMIQAYQRELVEIDDWIEFENEMWYS